MNRRQLFIGGLKIAGLTLAAQAAGIALGPSVSHAEERRRNSGATGPVLVSPTESTAVAVGYVEDAKKAPASKGNKCEGCQLYSGPQTVNGKKAGSCAIFPGKLVLNAGYCNSWTKKG